MISVVSLGDESGHTSSQMGVQSRRAPIQGTTPNSHCECLELCLPGHGGLRLELVLIFDHTQEAGELWHLCQPRQTLLEGRFCGIGDGFNFQCSGWYHVIAEPFLAITCGRHVIETGQWCQVALAMPCLFHLICTRFL